MNFVLLKLLFDQQQLFAHIYCYNCSNKSLLLYVCINFNHECVNELTENRRVSANVSKAISLNRLLSNENSLDRKIARFSTFSSIALNRKTEMRKNNYLCYQLF